MLNSMIEFLFGVFFPYFCSGFLPAFAGMTEEAKKSKCKIVERLLLRSACYEVQVVGISWIVERDA